MIPRALLWVGTLVLPAAAQVPDVPETLDLPTALRYAVDHNFAIQQARERIREQEGLITTVKSRVRPTATLNSSYSVQADELAGNNASSGQNWLVNLQVRQLLYSGGGVSAALDAQRYVRESALLDLQTVIHNELFGVRTRFYDLLLAREQIEVQDQNVRLLEEQLQIARNRFEAGAVSNFDVLRAEVELANAQPPLIRARNALRTAIDELRLSIGYDNTAPGNLVRVPEFVGDLTVQRVSYDLASSLQTALGSRPELLQLETLLEARAAGVTLAKSGRRPTVELLGGYQVRKDGASDRFRSSLDGWTVGVQSSWAIFDGKSTEGQVTQALSQEEQTRLQLEQTRLAVQVEVRRALSSLSEATELTDAAVRVVQQAEEALRLANARYGAGTATQLELLSAQVALTSARNNQLQANYSYNVAAAAMRRALGLGDVVISN